MKKVLLPVLLLALFGLGGCVAVPYGGGPAYGPGVSVGIYGGGSYGGHRGGHYRGHGGRHGY